MDNDDVCFRIPGTTEGIALHSIPPGQTYNVARSGDCDGPGDDSGPGNLPAWWFRSCPACGGSGSE